MTKVIKPKAIHTQVNIGKGTKQNPIRNVQQFHTLDGNFLFEYDPTTDKWYGIANLLEWLLPQKREG